jgi:hypothetical protein
VIHHRCGRPIYVWQGLVYLSRLINFQFHTQVELQLEVNNSSQDKTYQASLSLISFTIFLNCRYIKLLLSPICVWGESVIKIKINLNFQSRAQVNSSYLPSGQIWSAKSLITHFIYYENDIILIYCDPMSLWSPHLRLAGVNLFIKINQLPILYTSWTLNIHLKLITPLRTKLIRQVLKSFPLLFS